jgi:hypothetical protein
MVRWLQNDNQYKKFNSLVLEFAVRNPAETSFLRFKEQVASKFQNKISSVQH